MYPALLYITVLSLLSCTCSQKIKSIKNGDVKNLTNIIQYLLNFLQNIAMRLCDPRFNNYWSRNRKQYTDKKHK